MDKIGKALRVLFNWLWYACVWIVIFVNVIGGIKCAISLADEVNPTVWQIAGLIFIAANVAIFCTSKRLDKVKQKLKEWF